MVLSDGTILPLPNTFGQTDHPFFYSTSTHSLPQSNLAVMCCLTSLMRSWVRWPTSTCLLRSRISFITCQSLWNKSPSFFCGGRKTVERGAEKEKSQLGWMKGKSTRREGRMMTQIRRWKHTRSPPKGENEVPEHTWEKQIDTVREEGDPDRSL